MPGLELLMSAVSLALAAVPEGLPAIVTIALACRHAADGRAPRAAATIDGGRDGGLGKPDPGTLTTGVMVVREIWGANHKRILDVATACSDADLSVDERSGVGDPTEVAMVVAVAERGIRRRERAELELLGLLGIADPPRTKAIEAVTVAAAAGIRTVMITGDHKLTAHAIPRELGIVRDGESGDGIVHARATPESVRRA